MKKVLVIGSTVVDIIVNLDHLPTTGEDLNIDSQTMSLGGCPYNVANIIRHFDVPCLHMFPVGTGVYASFVETELAAQGLTAPVKITDRDNGCCYCFVDKTGERTFASLHGVEYEFSKEWMKDYPEDEFDMVYIAGLEIEEPTGMNIIEYLEAHPSYTIVFAPGPRILYYPEEKMQRILALHPILHVNEKEALDYSKTSDISEAGQKLFALTGNSVVITLGSRGAYCFDGHTEATIPAPPANVVDTIGAGDSHIGAVIAHLKLGNTLSEAVKAANQVSAKVVGIKGASISREELFRA